MLGKSLMNDSLRLRAVSSFRICRVAVIRAHQSELVFTSADIYDLKESVEKRYVRQVMLSISQARAHTLAFR